MKNFNRGATSIPESRVVVVDNHAGFLLAKLPGVHQSEPNGHESGPPKEVRPARPLSSLDFAEWRWQQQAHPPLHCSSLTCKKSTVAEALRIVTHLQFQDEKFSQLNLKITKIFRDLKIQMQLHKTFGNIVQYARAVLINILSLKHSSWTF